MIPTNPLILAMYRQLRSGSLILAGEGRQNFGRLEFLLDQGGGLIIFSDLEGLYMPHWQSF